MPTFNGFFSIFDAGGSKDPLESWESWDHAVSNAKKKKEMGSFEENDKIFLGQKLFGVEKLISSIGIL